MSLAQGSRIGSYEIHQLLGEGGMGQVYRGRDTRLNRDVAIKILPPSVANDPERLARFEREAKLLASLSHTNIAQIYGLEETEAHAGSGPSRVLVMELAPGDDLTIRIARGPMSVEDALPLAIQITSALEAAHERAIIHRDLKPANIKVSEDGGIKVLDFGLAKALSTGETDSASAMNSPTLTAQATAAGVILGTAAYMSPEQARGRDADKRADVWAFGVVFFEMLTGTRLFQGETISDTLAAVLRQDIPWAALPAGTPAELVRLLRRCLERDRKNRLHDISDARIVLEEVSRGGVKDEPRSAPAPLAARRLPWFMIAAGALGAIAMGFLIGTFTTAPTSGVAAASTVRFTIKAPPGVIEVGEPAVAPDGSFVIFRGQTASRGDQLYIQRLHESVPTPIARTESARLPFISWDARWVGFRRSNRLEKISLDGGEPLPITEVPTQSPGALWLPDNTILFAKSWLGGISAVSADAGAVREVSTLDVARGEIGHWFPTALPDARYVLITVWKKGAGVNDAEMAVLDLESGRHDVLFKGAEGRYLAPGFIVFFRAGAFHAVKFDPLTRKASGDPVRVVDDAYGNTPEGDISHTALSGGTMAYLVGPSTLVRALTWIAADGQATPTKYPARAYTGASISRDGHRAAVSAVESGRHMIRLLDFDSGREDLLDLPGSSWLPRWHPDGKRLAYRSMQKGDFDVYSKDVTSAAPPDPLLVTEFDDSPEGFLPDGKEIVVEQSNSSGQYLARLMPFGAVGPSQPLLAEPAAMVAVSPVGRTVAYIADRNGAREVYVQSIGTSSLPERASSGGAEAVAWSRDGRQLFYLRQPDILVVSFTIDGGRFRTTGERVWAKVAGDYSEHVFAPGADGRILVAISKDHTPREIRVVVNLSTEVSKKVK